MQDKNKRSDGSIGTLCIISIITIILIIITINITITLIIPIKTLTTHANKKA